MRLTSLKEPEGTRHSLHEADKVSDSEWPQFLSCKFEAFENTNHDSVLTFDRRDTLKISKRDLQEPTSGQDGSKFRYATTRRGLVLKLSIALGFKFHDQWSQNMLKAHKHLQTMFADQASKHVQVYRPSSYSIADQAFVDLHSSICWFADQALDGLQTSH